MQFEPKRQPQRPSDNDFRRPSVTREIVIPIGLDDYREIVGDNDRFRSLLAQLYERHPACFPLAFDANFSFKDFKYSKKMDVRIRRIRVGLGTDAHFWRVVPCDVMPYMVGRTDEVEKALFLRKFNVPYWGLDLDDRRRARGLGGGAADHLHPAPLHRDA